MSLSIKLGSSSSYLMEVLWEFEVLIHMWHLAQHLETKFPVELISHPSLISCNFNVNTTATSLGSTTLSSGTNTTATISSVTSTSTAPPMKEENPSGHLRPWEVVLATLALVAVAVILLTGLLFHFMSAWCIGNPFSEGKRAGKWGRN